LAVALPLTVAEATADATVLARALGCVVAEAEGEPATATTELVGVPELSPFAPP
jgi:hypothetical protein